MFENDDKATLKHDAEMYSMVFVILGVICFVSYFIQVSVQWIKQIWMWLLFMLSSLFELNIITK